MPPRALRRAATALTVGTPYRAARPKLRRAVWLQIRWQEDRIILRPGRIRAAEAPTCNQAMGSLRRPTPSREVPNGRVAPPLPFSPAARLPEARSGNGEGGEEVGEG